MPILSRAEVPRDLDVTSSLLGVLCYARRDVIYGNLVVVAKIFCMLFWCG